MVFCNPFKLRKISIHVFFAIFHFTAIAKTSNVKFIENKGQWKCNERFKAQVGNNNIYFSENSIIYNLIDESALEEIEKQNNESTKHLVKAHALKIYFLNSYIGNELKPLNKRHETSNYFIGNDKNFWKKEVKAYDKLQYKNLYKGIDLYYYGNDNGLKYDINIKPGADHTQIQLLYKGQETIAIENGKLKITTSIGIVYEEKPYAYQMINGKKIEIPCQFKLADNTLSFSFPEGYNKKEEVIIDPNVIFSTYSSSTVLLSADASTYDSQGNMYIAAGCFDTGYQGTPGAYLPAISGFGFDWNMVIEKYNTTGSLLLYSTYLGGTVPAVTFSNADDYPYSLFCDNNDNLFILGTSSSADYPITTGCLQDKNSGSDDYVISKLNTSGTTLVASTYLGGTLMEGGGFQSNVSSIFLDAANNVYICGLTQSIDYPITPGVFQGSLAGILDGAVTKLNDNLNSLIWSTYIGGSGIDDVCDIKIAPNGSVYICGNTTSTDFPGVTGGVNSTHVGGQEGFVTCINSNATTIIQSSYLGTSTIDSLAIDQAKFLQIDASTNIYVLGSTTASQYPVTPGAYNMPGTFNYFIHKLTSSLKNTIFSCCIGGADSFASNIYAFVPTAFGIDPCNNMHFSGSNLNGGLPLTSNALSSTPKSIYLCSISNSGSNLLFGSYFGGQVSNSGGMSGGHIHLSTNNRFNSNGVLFHTECTQDGSYTLVNPTFTDKNGNGHNAASFKLDIGFLTNSFSATIPTNQITQPACGNNNGSATVMVTGGSGNYTYLWLPSGGTNPVASNLSQGTYSVKVTDLNPSCGQGSQTITVVLTNSNNPQPINATAQSTNPACGTNDGAIIINPTGGSQNYLFTWVPNISSGNTASNVAPNTYSIIISDNVSNCPANSDTVIVNISSGTIQADEVHTNLICYGNNNATAQINVTGNSGPITYQWNNGNTTAFANNLSAGSYSVNVSDTNKCETNVVFQINEPDQPIITSTISKDISSNVGTASVFITGLTNPLTYTWSTQPPQYTQTATEMPTGTYTVSVQDINGCIAKLEIKIEGSLEIPNVITPNSDGVNEVFHIKNLPPNSSLSIFNRWGNKLYEVNNYQNDWNGSKYTEGTYFYVLITEKAEKFTGYFQLIK